MGKFQKLAMAGTVAAFGLGMGAATVSAYSISGGAYTSERSGTHSFTVGGSYTYTCPTKAGPPITDGAIFSGTATGADSTDFTPSLSNCKALGFPMNVVQSGTLNFKIHSGPDVSGYYTGEITIPATTTTTTSIPIMGCTWTVTGPQVFQHGGNGGLDVVKAKNWTSGTGIDLEAVVSGVTYVKSGTCPFSSGSNGVYSTGGVTKIPGITIS